MQELAHQSADGDAGALGQFVAVGKLQSGRRQRQAGAPCVAVHLFQGLCAKPAFGLVVDPFERQVILRLRNQPQIGQRIADLCAFVETEPPNDAVIDADLDEAVFEFAGLILRAHQNGDLAQRCAFTLQPLDRLAHAARFFGCVPYPDHLDLVAAVDVRPQGLVVALAVGPDQPRRRAQNMRGGAVVLFQPDHLGTGKILFEAQDIGDLGPAPRIDRLVIIPDDADVLVSLCQQPQPQILHGIGVLIFVHHDIPKCPLIISENIVMLLQDV